MTFLDSLPTSLRVQTGVISLEENSISRAHKSETIMSDLG